MRMVHALAVASSLMPFAASADGVELPDGIDIFILGEIHDNAAHHAEQTRLVAEIAPGAVVWEMMTVKQLANAAGVDRADKDAFAEAVGWQAAGWPDFGMYHPILVASDNAAQIGGAVPRDVLLGAMTGGALAAFGDAPSYFDAALALAPLTDADRTAREAEQALAHCGALPSAMLPGMVEAQRLRDAYMASAAIGALEAGLGPVVVIAGSGHARLDTGIPAMIRAARPDIAVWALGQFEGDPGPDAPFDAVNITSVAPRADPCDAFR